MKRNELHKMATSSIRFSDKDIFLKDDKLGHFISALSTQCAEFIQNHPDEIETVLLACQRWCDDYEEMPPGLKDIELDELIDGGDVQRVFEAVLQSMASPSAGDVIEHKASSEIAGKVLEMLR